LGSREVADVVKASSGTPAFKKGPKIFDEIVAWIAK
jgi:hypothetical protein